MNMLLPRTISWLHFGDLHITTEDQPNYRDFIALIEEANDHIASTVDFAVLPGDNADDGIQEQYRLIRRATERLQIPLEVRTGDHDRKSGTLDAYRRILEPQLWRTRVVGEYRCLFLNSLDGSRKDAFELGAQQRAWFLDQCAAAQRSAQTLALFMHAYPSEHGESSTMLREAIAGHPIAVVDMGHTHYNELANDGHTIYAATRSTGQIEEGNAGFSLTTIDRGVVSWKFHELGQWPFVKIVSPADRLLIIDPNSPDQVVCGNVEIRARVWGGGERSVVSVQIDEGYPTSMKPIPHSNSFRIEWPSSDVSDGPHRMIVRAVTSQGTATDTITVFCSQCDAYERPPRSALDVDNAIPAYPEKGILGTRLGPNANGRKW